MVTGNWSAEQQEAALKDPLVMQLLQQEQAEARYSLQQVRASLQPPPNPPHPTHPTAPTRPPHPTRLAQCHHAPRLGRGALPLDCIIQHDCRLQQGTCRTAVLLPECPRHARRSPT